LRAVRVVQAATAVILARLIGRLRRLALLVASTVVATALIWAAGELFFRWRFPPSYTADPTLVVDATLGWDSLPTVSTLEGNTAGRPVVAFLGDSFTHGRLWPGEAQRILLADGIAMNGVNLGVSGYGTVQEWLKLQRNTPGIAPSAVIVLFFAWNDLRDNYPYPELFYGPQRTSRPYLLLRGSDISVSPVRWSAGVDRLLLQSEFYLRVTKLHAAIIERWPDLPSQFEWRAKVYYEHPAGWHPFYDPALANSAYVRGAYATTIAAFRAIRDLARGAPVLVIGIDNAFTVDQDIAKLFIAPHPELDPSLPLNRMASLLRPEGIDFINAQPELVALAKATGRNLYNGPRTGLAGHLEPEGDRLIGTIAARWLATALRGRDQRPSR
jgi:hypothetical protein